MILDNSASFDLVSFFLIRGISLVYFIAFLIFWRQYTGLVGQNGLKPVKNKAADIWDYFSLFYWLPYDKVMNYSALLGLFLSGSIFLGLGESLGIYYSVFCWVTLWIIFNSFVNSGDIFTAPGWERILSESGFLAIFLINSSITTPFILILLFRWVLFRMMLGSAVVKLRGGNEWLNLSALGKFFESQPFPGPLSWHFHNLPDIILRIAALSVQLVLTLVPFLYFAPQPYAALGGAITILLQIIIFFSGNFAWLNLITAVLALTTFTDRILSNFLVLPMNTSSYPSPDILGLTFLFFAGLSAVPLLNFFSKDPGQNASYNPLNLANSYGAFPDVNESHLQLVIEGRKDGEWKEYGLNYSLRDPEKRPRQIAPYHYMLEYMTDFYLQGKTDKEEWLEKLIQKLLEEEEEILKLIDDNPFDEAPEKIRAMKYRYRFMDTGERKSKAIYWEREPIEKLKEIS